MARWIRHIPKPRVRNAAKQPEYASWDSMIHRCYNSSATGFPYYVGKGVTVHEPWIQSFQQFKDDLGTRPPNHELSRNNDSGNYEPGNCQWLPAANNRNPVLFTHKS